MKIAVTGCNGSIGTRVVLSVLAQGHSVVGIDCTPMPDVLSGHLPEHEGSFTFHQADLKDYTVALKLLEGCDGVVHLAAMRTPGDYAVAAHNTNVVLSWNILRAAAELGVNRVAQASSVNVIPLVWTERKDFEYFPLDEDHPCRPDEPYGLSKVICELQADTIVRRYPTMRVASLRLSWSLPAREDALRDDPARRKNDLWGYVQEDSGADAFLLAVTVAGGGGGDRGGDRAGWSGHEAFFITAPDTASEVPTMELYERYWAGVPIKKGKALDGRTGFFDCSKAERLLGWVHRNPGEEP